MASEEGAPPQHLLEMINLHSTQVLYAWHLRMVSPEPAGGDYLVVCQVLDLAPEDGVPPQHLQEMITL